MGTRLTEKPLRIGFDLAETAANTFTTSPINLPTVPVIQVRGSGRKAIGVEIMKVKDSTQPPDAESGQDNTFTAALVKGPAPTAVPGPEAQRAIWRRVRRADHTTVTAVGEITQHDQGDDVVWDLTDGDGNGEIVADNEIHIAVLGGGNAAAKRTRGYILYHLYELDQDEAVSEMIETALA